MLIQYIKFFINGGVLGILAWALQWCIYKLLNGHSSIEYAMATVLTYLPLIVVNFLIQRKWIFNRAGLFKRFVIANLIIMVLVSVLSPLFRLLIDHLFESPWGDRLGFILAGLTGSLPSFLLKRSWVFGIGFKND